MHQPGYSKNITGQTVFEIRHEDITKFNCDAIVNAANSRLQHFGGLAAAIVDKGGHEIQEESDIWVNHKGPISFDQCAITSAGRLPCKWVIHAVGPQWGEGQEENKLIRTFTSAITSAELLRVQWLGIPPISTGIFGVPKHIAASALSKVLEGYFSRMASVIKIVSLVIIDTETYQSFEEYFRIKN